MTSPLLLVPADEESRWRFAAARLDRFEHRPISRPARLLARMAPVIAALALLVLLVGAVAGLLGHAVRWPWGAETAGWSVSTGLLPLIVAVGSLALRTLGLNRSFPWLPTLRVVGETRRQRTEIRQLLAQGAVPGDPVRAAVVRGIAREEQSDGGSRLALLVGFALVLVPDLASADAVDRVLSGGLLAGTAVAGASAATRFLRARRYARLRPAPPAQS